MRIRTPTATGLDVVLEWGRLDSSVYYKMTDSLLRIRRAMEKSIDMSWFNPLRLFWIIDIHIQSFQLRRLYIYLGKLKDVYLLHMELPYKEKEE